MFTIIAIIAGAVALGCAIFYAIKLTIRWIRNKVKDLLTKKNAKKAAVADISKLVNECENKMSMEEFENLADKGYTHFTVGIDENNKVVGDVEFIKDENNSLDEEVNALIGKKGMVVIEN